MFVDNADHADGRHHQANNIDTTDMFDARAPNATIKSSILACLGVLTSMPCSGTRICSRPPVWIRKTTETWEQMLSMPTS
jgi:hypothetical protein